MDINTMYNTYNPMDMTFKEYVNPMELYMISQDIV